MDGVEQPLTKIPFGGAATRREVIALRSPASQVLRLPGLTAGAAITESKVLAWIPEDKQASQIEVRARIVGATGSVGPVPIVRWTDETGHGTAVWREPQPTLQQISGTPMADYSLPARGMTWRVSGREFRISFRNAGAFAGPPIEEVVVQVSINPCSGSVADRYPYQHLAGPTLATVQQPFPMTAREFRLHGLDGLPVPAGPGVLFVGCIGALFGAGLASAYSDWTPIPHDARAWVPTDPMYAVYR